MARYGAGWLVVQDDATHACVWESGTGRALRLVAPVEGHDTFDEASGTKALKPDLEAVVALPDGRTLALGSGSTHARMRCVLLSDSTVQVAGLAPIYARVAELLEVPAGPAQPRGRRRGRRSLRWFQRGLPSAGRTERQRRRRADGLLDHAPALRPPSGSRVCAATTSARSPASGSRSPMRSACRAASCWSAPRRRTRPTTYDDGPVVGSALALLDGERLLDLAELPLLDGEVAKLEGLALVGHRDDLLDLVAVVDADDPEVPSLLLELVVGALRTLSLSCRRRHPCRGRTGCSR